MELQDLRFINVNYRIFIFVCTMGKVLDVVGFVGQSIGSRVCVVSGEVCRRVRFRVKCFVFCFGGVICGCEFIESFVETLFVNWGRYCGLFAILIYCECLKCFSVSRWVDRLWFSGVLSRRQLYLEILVVDGKKQGFFCGVNGLWIVLEGCYKIVGCGFFRFFRGGVGKVVIFLFGIVFIRFYQDVCLRL